MYPLLNLSTSRYSDISYLYTTRLYILTCGDAFSGYRIKNPFLPVEQTAHREEYILKIQCIIRLIILRLNPWPVVRRREKS